MSHAIVVENLSKNYLLKHRRREGMAYRTLREALIENAAKAARFFRDGKISHGDSEEVFWALRDVSFNVEEGERLAIIGRNGAGKSTLLKLLSRITEPSNGVIKIRGRLSSLLEVGTGFHPELTGRENIYLNGAVLGMRREEVRQKFDEIAQFAEIENFLDTPVKRYSSGMYVRLAFSVSAFLSTDILILDEVLSVGDASFQRKCHAKMQELARNGRTILFVSHSMSAIKTMCQTGIVLTKGVASQKMPVEQAISQYISTTVPASTGDRMVSGPVAITLFEMRQGGVPGAEFEADAPIELLIEFELEEDVPDFRIGAHLRTLFGDLLVRSLLADWNPELAHLKKGKYLIKNEFPARYFVSGSFQLTLHCTRFGITDYFPSEITISFRVHQSEKYNLVYPQEEPFGFLNITQPWTVEKQ